MSYECCGDGHAVGDAFLAFLGAAIRPLSELYRIILDFLCESLLHSDSLGQPVFLVFVSISLLVTVVIVSCFHASFTSPLAGTNASCQRDWLLRDRSRGAEPHLHKDTMSSATAPDSCADDFARTLEQKRRWISERGTKSRPKGQGNLGESTSLWCSGLPGLPACLLAYSKRWVCAHARIYVYSRDQLSSPSFGDSILL